ncbi:hypothetical protein HYPSUDRAFT_205861 [Hypholoma sublateritium FD-334 SS-4]|uniref:T6SS Phospholipase effector Tle1-like catalytic domain-containing protein n=1 Tax=Hypholoma sublateritium (strain FD-334 SS-4) TaxID=945553 RepID=A0A0D2NFX7_HYPSF|nr:hypothetical protein HYPSUDRAFT_205861 [Hypholoma sublateritium FD-334 SS-4]
MPENNAADEVLQSPFLSPTELPGSDSATVVGSPAAQSGINGSAPLPPLPRYIPDGHPARTLVLCFDGTGDQFDSDNSNIVALFTLLKKDDSDKQMVYYQAGIGTYVSPQIATPMASKISKSLDEAIAWNLHSHLMDGYEFLMQNYKAGDRICIFGFSRGAYTARGLAGMIHKVGLLPACNHQQVPFAYKMYSDASEEGWKQSGAFKKAFSVDVPIEFVGVWDTVNSVGLIPRRLPFTTSNTIIRTFRHAVALDERRAKFKANLWNHPTPVESTLGVNGQKPEVKFKAHRPNAKKTTLKAMERQYSKESDNGPTDIEEVWFAGCHCDVGGGSVDNDTSHSLARIPLRWMIRECFKADTGIMFDAEGLREVGIDPSTLYPFVLARPPPLSAAGKRIKSVHDPAPENYEDYAGLSAFSSEQLKIEEYHELQDALSPIYDQLDLAWFWWILEYIPFRQKYQKGDNTWETSFVRNKGNPRRIPKQKKYIVKVHRSVKMRMDASDDNGVKYVPKASFETALGLGNVQWVD